MIFSGGTAISDVRLALGHRRLLRRVFHGLADACVPDVRDIAAGGDEAAEELGLQLLPARGGPAGGGTDIRDGAISSGVGR